MYRMAIVVPLVALAAPARADRFRSRHRPKRVDIEDTEQAKSALVEKPEPDEIVAELSFALSLDSERAPSAGLAAEYTLNHVAWNPRVQAKLAQDDDLSASGSSSAQVALSVAPAVHQGRPLEWRVGLAGCACEDAMTSEVQFHGGPELEATWERGAFSVEPSVELRIGTDIGYAAELSATYEVIDDRFETSATVSSEGAFDDLAPETELAVAVSAARFKLTGSASYSIDDDVFKAGVALEGRLDLK
jgi:hypothetical protein